MLFDVTVKEPGALGSPMVTALLAVLVPVAFEAVTEIEYEAVVVDRPIKVQPVTGASAVHVTVVPLLADAVTVYEAMAWPPSDVDAAHVTVACPPEPGVTRIEGGAEGAVTG